MNRSASLSKPLTWFVAVLLSALVAGCGGGSSSGGAASSPDPTLTVPPGAGTGVGGLGKGPAPVDLGMAGNYAILAESLISTTTGTEVTGNLGISPQAATYIQGFSLILDSGGCFSTSDPTSLVVGQVFAADYNMPASCPTPANLTTAIGNKGAAYTDANSRAPDYTELGAGAIGGMTLPPAVYKWGTGLSILSDVTLKGGPNDVWIFQIAQGITMASGVRVTLAGGALPKNIFWASFGVVKVGTTAHLEGIVLSQTSVVMDTGASANGRLLAHTEVTLDDNTVVQPN